MSAARRGAPSIGPDAEPRHRSRVLLVVLAFLAYVPLLLTSPGQISADTKTFLYLDPGQLLGRATSMWDPNIALGYVPHQNIGYLWPMGPWFWALDALGVPDWVAQRLWWGTLIFAAGAGVAVLLRRLGWRTEAAGVAALCYMFSPYLLTLLARLSGILMPYAALPWLVLLTVLSARARGWRHPAAFALVAATAGAMNLTALVLVGLAPVLWLFHAVVVAREIRPADALRAAGRIAALTAVVSVWWLVGLVVQAGYGNDVLRYSETADVVARTSTANEILRGLGYWFFYGGDRLGPWIEPSVDYTQTLWLLAASYLIPVAALVGAAVGRWRHRAFCIALVVVGVVIAVGPYPWPDPPPLGQAIRAFLLTERGLAMRSLPRAAPLAILGLAVLLGSGVAAVLRRWPNVGRAAAGGAVVLVLVAQPTILTGQAVPTNLRRSEALPQYWLEAAEHLDAGDPATRVLEVPGSDFAAYRWGSTVDPITPGLVERDVAYRELIPFSSPAAAAMLDAFDLPFQEGTMAPEAIAPIARLLRAGDILVRSDLEFERFNTPRPKDQWALVTSAPGLGEPVELGPAAPNLPHPEASLEDEAWLLTDDQLPDPPEVGIVPVDDPIQMLSAHASTGPLVVAGDATALVDAAAAGLIDGTELIRFSADLDEDGVSEAMADDATVLITDGNRRRGQRWHTVRHTLGYTEPAGLEPLVEDPSDNRLPVLDGHGDDGRTVAVHEGDLTANATSYGNEITYEPHHRPAAAVDGDPRTAWRTAGLADARGERLEITLDEAITTDRVRLLQPASAEINRHVGRARLHFDGGASEDVELDATSLAEPGQLVTFTTRTFTTLEIEVLDDDVSDRPTYDGMSSVGFAEVHIEDDPSLVLDEWVRTPVDLMGADLGEQPVSVLVTRHRQRPSDTTRDDDEWRMARLVTLPARRTMALSGTARLSARASDAVLASALGRPSSVEATSTGRLVGSLAEVGAAALDGDLATAWISPRNAATGHGLQIASDTRFTIDHLDLSVIADGRHSVPTRLELTVDGGVPITVEVPSPAASATPGAVATVPVTLPEPLRGSLLEVLVIEAERVKVTDWNSRLPVDQPVAIAELGIPGLVVPPLGERFDSGCRSDLVEVDGAAVPVRVQGLMDDALAGAGLPLAPCTPGSLDLAAGEHRLRTAVGRDVGIDVDQLLLRSSPVDGSPGPAPAVTTRATASDAHEIEVTGDPHGEAWLVFGQSFNEGWKATSGEDDLGAPRLVDGFANGWRVPLGADGRAVVQLDFEPQRGVRLGLIVSAVGAVLCLVLIWRGRAAPSGPVAPVEPASLAAVRAYRGAVPSTGATWGAALAAGAVGLLVLPPVYAVVLAVTTAVACRRERTRVWLLAASPLLALMTGTYVVVQQARHGIPAGSDWPAAQSRAHDVAMLAVLVLAVDGLVDALWERATARRRR